jgi:4-hydroxy-tetrahydrodipicolinate reductase
MLKICLIGYGKMGKMIEQLAPEKGCEIVSIIDPKGQDHHAEITRQSLAGADIAIDFSHPSAVMSNLDKLIKQGQSSVIGTTGWHEHLQDIKLQAGKQDMGLLYGSNFSLGMNLFSRLVAGAVEIFDSFDDYDLLAWEKHHAQKADSPSGTAIELAQLILQKSSRKDSVVWDKLDRRPQASELHFASIRGGKIPGTHALAFDSEMDTIELSHVVRSRATFAVGALLAAKWLHGKQGVYSFQDMLSEILC